MNLKKIWKRIVYEKKPAFLINPTNGAITFPNMKLIKRMKMIKVLK